MTRKFSPVELLRIRQALNRREFEQRRVKRLSNQKAIPPSATFLGKDANDGRPIVRLSTGEMVKGDSIITNGYLVPGQSCVWRNGIVDGMPHVKPKRKVDQTSKSKTAEIIYLYTTNSLYASVPEENVNLFYLAGLDEEVRASSSPFLFYPYQGYKTQYDDDTWKVMVLDKTVLPSVIRVTTPEGETTEPYSGTLTDEDGLINPIFDTYGPVFPSSDRRHAVAFSLEGQKFLTYNGTTTPDEVEIDRPDWWFCGVGDGVFYAIERTDATDLTQKETLDIVRCGPDGTTLETRKATLTPPFYSPDVGVQSVVFRGCLSIAVIPF